jgi:hypothetical protein
MFNICRRPSDLARAEMLSSVHVVVIDKSCSSAAAVVDSSSVSKIRLGSRVLCGLRENILKIEQTEADHEVKVDTLLKGIRGGHLHISTRSNESVAFEREKRHISLLHLESYRRLHQCIW